MYRIPGPFVVDGIEYDPYEAHESGRLFVRPMFQLMEQGTTILEDDAAHWPEPHRFHDLGGVATD